MTHFKQHMYRFEKALLQVAQLAEKLATPNPPAVAPTSSPPLAASDPSFFSNSSRGNLQWPPIADSIPRSLTDVHDIILRHYDAMKVRVQVI